MKNKLGLILLSIFTISFFIDLYNIVIEDWNELILFSSEKEFYIAIMFCSIISLIINLIKFSFLIGIYIAVKLVNKKMNKSKLAEVDLKKYDGYFRDTLKNYDIAVLSYIDDFSLDYPKDIVAVLLNLKNKGKIEFDEINNKIIVNKKNVILSRVEQYLINNIVDGKVQVHKFNLHTVIEDAEESNLLKSNNKLFNAKKMFLIIFGYIVANITIFNLLANLNFEGNIIVIFFIILIILYIFMNFFLPVYGIIYFIKQISNPYVRNEKGEEINVKLEGLKNYLKDFSSLDRKKLEDLILWDEYLIYSVLFNQNKSIVKEIYNKYFEKNSLN